MTSVTRSGFAALKAFGLAKCVSTIQTCLRLTEPPSGSRSKMRPRSAKAVLRRSGPRDSSLQRGSRSTCAL